MPMPYHVLLIQDDATGAASVHEALIGSGDRSFTLEQVPTYAEGLKRLVRADGVNRAASSVP